MRHYFIWQDFVDANLILKESKCNSQTNKVERIEYINSNVLFAIQSNLRHKGISFSIPTNILCDQKLTREQYEKSFVPLNEGVQIFSYQRLDNEYYKCLGEVGPFDI